MVVVVVVVVVVVEEGRSEVGPRQQLQPAVGARPPSCSSRNSDMRLCSGTGGAASPSTVALEGASPVDVDVADADGGGRSAAITRAMSALAWRSTDAPHVGHVRSASAIMWRSPHSRHHTWHSTPTSASAIATQQQRARWTGTMLRLPSRLSFATWRSQQHTPNLRKRDLAASKLSKGQVV